MIAKFRFVITTRNRKIENIDIPVIYFCWQGIKCRRWEYARLACRRALHIPISDILLATTIGIGDVLWPGAICGLLTSQYAYPP